MVIDGEKYWNMMTNGIEYKTFFNPLKIKKEMPLSDPWAVLFGGENTAQENSSRVQAGPEKTATGRKI